MAHRHSILLVAWFAALGCIAALGCGAPDPDPDPDSDADSDSFENIAEQGLEVAKPVLLARNGRFVDKRNRVILLRGVNVAGTSKVPPFASHVGTADLDRLKASGMNVVRLLFMWEAYEPTPGAYDDAYLQGLRRLAEAAWARGMYVVVDIHQDGFSRFTSAGCGDGFPRWAVATVVRATGTDTPANHDAKCHGWALKVAKDWKMHLSFHDFYANVAGVRDAYLEMLQRVAAALAPVPGVIGYDPLNEPWGDERRELMPLYVDAATRIRSVDPHAILFLEGHVLTNSGLQTSLPLPPIANVAYAPHFYDSITLQTNEWSTGTWPADFAFHQMTNKAREWNAPLFVGEYGINATAEGADDYVTMVSRHLDDAFVSGAQWNYAPGWTPTSKDGWNGEDLSMIDHRGRPRLNFQRRAYPRATAGEPTRFLQDETHVELAWTNIPPRGQTELFVPKALFGEGAILTAEGPDLSCAFDAAGTVLRCRSGVVAKVRVSVRAR